VDAIKIATIHGRRARETSSSVGIVIDDEIIVDSTSSTRRLTPEPLLRKIRRNGYGRIKLMRGFATFKAANTQTSEDCGINLEHADIHSWEVERTSILNKTTTVDRELGDTETNCFTNDVSCSDDGIEVSKSMSDKLRVVSSAVEANHMSRAFLETTRT
jgi:hypothetical protein